MKKFIDKSCAQYLSILPKPSSDTSYLVIMLIEMKNIGMLSHTTAWAEIGESVVSKLINFSLDFHFDSVSGANKVMIYKRTEDRQMRRLK